MQSERNLNAVAFCELSAVCAVTDSAGVWHPGSAGSPPSRSSKINQVGTISQVAVVRALPVRLSATWTLYVAGPGNS